MFYKLFRQLAKLSFLIFFRHIHVSNYKNVPLDKPTILCCNHPNGFLEPCLLACFLRMPLYFLARGDLFSVKWLKWILKATNQIPIYRFRDGFSGLRGNDNSFQYCYKILNERKHILIFPEGSTEQVRYLRPLQKGPARLAFGAQDKFPDLDIQMVPVQIHFTAPTKFRSEVLLNIGEPIDVKEYSAMHGENPKKAVQDLTDLISMRMKSLGVHVKDEKEWSSIENIWKLTNSEFGILGWWPISNTDSNLLPSFISKIQKMNALSGSKKSEFTTEIDGYFGQLKQFKLKDKIVKIGTKGFFLNIAVMIITFVPAFIGFVFAIIPAILVKKFANVKVKDVEFYSSILSTVGMFVFILNYLLIFGIALYLFSLKGLWVLILPFFGYLAVIHIENIKNLLNQIKWLLLPQKIKLALRKIRENLIGQINQL